MVLFWRKISVRERGEILLYDYAVSKYHIKTIAHKFLIKRAHPKRKGQCPFCSREANKKSLKSESIYVPDQYISRVRAAKSVMELCHADFWVLTRSNEIGKQC
jgi:hypothetical protein